jgi:signal transduction histidine kinase
MRASASCLFHKNAFLGGKGVGTLLLVGAVELSGVVGAVALALLAVRRALLRRRGLARGLLRWVQAIPDALGDAALVLDPAGRVVLANLAAARLAGRALADLLDHDVRELSPDLAALARGLERGPAAARVSIAGGAGPVRARAALARVSSRPPLALVVLRPLPAPRPPPLPAARAAPWTERGAARAGLAAAAAALREPAAEATDALALLRLSAPALPPAAASALAGAEAALAVASRRIAALGSAGELGARRTLDLAALVEELAAAFPPPPGVQVRLELGAARAVADDRPLRAALRELLGAAAAALHGEGEIAVGARTAADAVTVEIRAPGGVPEDRLALARALVAPQGGRVQEDAAPGRGSIVRVALERAVALEPA